MFLLNFVWMVKEYPGVGDADVSVLRKIVRDLRDLSEQSGTFLNI